MANVTLCMNSLCSGVDCVANSYFSYYECINMDNPIINVRCSDMYKGKLLPVLWMNYKLGAYTEKIRDGWDLEQSLSLTRHTVPETSLHIP